jgi:hypothetical protein
MTTEATVDGYLSKLPQERRDAIMRVRDVINAKLPHGYEERFQYGMISWCVPESVLPAKEVYNKQPLALASLGSQKNYMTLHLMQLYMNQKERAWFERAYKQTGKKLDLGGGCVRFKTLDALPLEVVGEAVSHMPVDSWVECYRSARASRTSAKGSTKTAKTAKPAKPAAKKPAKKQAAKKSSKKR